MATEKQSVNTSIEVFSEIIEKHGHAVMQKAVEQVLVSNYEMGSVSSALKHHMKFLPYVLPLVPALMALSCEVAGGEEDKVVDVGAALTIFVEAANIHDDIMDQTQIKDNRKTIFGIYGTDIALLAGDFLLVQASLSLFRACELLPHEQKDTVIALTFDALSKISKSAAKESKMRRKFDTSPKDYLQVVQLRASVPETHCMIAAILGGGSKRMVSCLGNYGRHYGIVGTVIDEFLDLFDYQKFSDRLSKECVPLPVLCALQNAEIKEKILPLMNDFKIDENDFSQLVRLVMESEEVLNLKKEILLLITDVDLEISREFKESDARRNLTTLLKIVGSLLCNVKEFTNRML